MSVSVVIPAFNRPRRLRRSVECVLGQTHRDFELVVVDDASTEDLSGVRERVESAGHRWIRFDEDRGPAAARNAGAAATTGEWIAFLDSDDRWLPEKLERQIAWHRSHPEIEISQCEEVWIRNGVPVKKPGHLRQPETGDVFEVCAERCCISCTGVMLSRELWNRSGGFDESLWTCEDYELWLRIAAGHEVGLVPGSLAEKHGGHPDQMSYSFRAIDRWRVLALLKLLGSDLPARKRAIAIGGIAEKAGVLAAGALKRDLPEAALYRAIEEWARQPGGEVPLNLVAALRESVSGELGYKGQVRNGAAGKDQASGS